jgi:outer membrane protein OmpA-like peptidoglycan-associated protein
MFNTPASLSLLACVLAVAGCATVKPAAPPASAVEQRAAAPSALAVERQWLQSWFQDTPVRIEQFRDGPVTVTVPREFCFDAGRSTIKPALAAVLDKVTESLRRLPLAQLSLAAPDDATGSSPLALQRAAQVQKHLLSRGAPAAQVGKPAAAAVAAVQLRLETAAP